MLSDALLRDDKIIPLDDLSKCLAGLRDQKKVLVGGCFDIFHYGHLQFLSNAKKSGAVLLVALESDKFIINRKKRKPIHTQIQRASILASLECVDIVLLLPFFQDDGQYYTLVSEICPDVIAVTEGDYNIDKKRKQAEKIGSTVLVVSKLLSTFSTSQILEGST
ncbi:MAG: adenylyltransferase/cytidyltransferase family protein [Candidatus Roizmanbacteria bacterium]